MVYELAEKFSSMFSKFFLLIIFSFHSIYSIQINNTVVSYQNKTVLAFNQYDVNISLPSVNSSLILSISSKSSNSCLIQCEHQRQRVCKSYVFKNNQNINNCFLYNRTFDFLTEIIKHDDSNLFFLVQNSSNVLNSVPSKTCKFKKLVNLIFRLFH